MRREIDKQMGLHRDGQNWDLAEQDLEQRRMVFWEIYSTEIFMVSLR